MEGWAKIYRSLADHELWLAEPFTYGQAWVDIFLNANHAPGSFMVKRQRVSLERGQLGWSEITMTERWKWSRGKVRRFLKRLSSDGMIEQQAGHLTSVITICNYDDYQGNQKEGDTSNGTTGSTADGTPDGHLTVHEAVHKQECKEELELKNGKKTKAPTAAKTPIDFSPFNASDDQIAEIKRIRRQNKGGAITQRVVNGLAKELTQGQTMGYTLDELLTEWEVRGWKSFKAEWVKPKAVAGMNPRDAQRQQIIADRNRELGIDQPPPAQGDFIDGEVTRHD
jgi:hypothetical protein